MCEKMCVQDYKTILRIPTDFNKRNCKFCPPKELNYAAIKTNEATLHCCRTISRKNISEISSHMS